MYILLPELRQPGHQLRSFECFSGLDVIAQAQSGTGKTATFSVAILQKLDVNNKYCQALVLAPTRELAQQVNFLLNKTI